MKMDLHNYDSQLSFIFAGIDICTSMLCSQHTMQENDQTCWLCHVSPDWLLNWCALIIAITLSQPTSSWHVQTTLSSSHDSYHTHCSPTEL